MFDGVIFIPDMQKGFHSDFQMLFYVIQGDLFIRFGGFDSFRNHGAVGHEQECACGNAVGESDDKDGGRFHIDGHGPGFYKIFFKTVVVFPHPPVGGVDDAGVILAGVGGYHPGTGFLYAECGQRGNFMRHIVVGGPFPFYGGDGQDVVADGNTLFQAAALAEKKDGLHFYRREQVYDGGGIGASHTEIYQDDVAAGDIGHGLVRPDNRYTVDFCKQFQIIFEIGQQHVFRKIFQPPSGVPGQPVFYNFFFCFHSKNMTG